MAGVGSEVMDYVVRVRCLRGGLKPGSCLYCGSCGRPSIGVHRIGKIDERKTISLSSSPHTSLTSGERILHSWHAIVYGKPQCRTVQFLFKIYPRNIEILWFHAISWYCHGNSHLALHAHENMGIISPSSSKQDTWYQNETHSTSQPSSSLFHQQEQPYTCFDKTTCLHTVIQPYPSDHHSGVSFL